MYVLVALLHADQEPPTSMDGYLMNSSCVSSSELTGHKALHDMSVLQGQLGLLMEKLSSNSSIWQETLIEGHRILQACRGAVLQVN
jgi:hypothetical protein